MIKKYKIKKNTLGYFFVNPIPDKILLNDYYKKKYFNKNISYKYKLDKVENIYLKVNALLKIFMLRNKTKKNLKFSKILDLGAGTGSFLANIKKYFAYHLGVDFSKNNLNKRINFFEDSPENYILKNIKKFDVITLNNVLEHIPEPSIFLKKLYKNTSQHTKFLITVPNDFSLLQKATIKITKKKHWLAPPEHLNYFNNQNFINFAKKHKFTVIDAISDFPIELFLLKKNFNYTSNKKLGKSIHLLRCEIITYLYKNNKFKNLYKLFKIFYELNIGRDTTFLLKKIN